MVILTSNGAGNNYRRRQLLPTTNYLMREKGEKVGEVCTCNMADVVVVVLVEGISSYGRLRQRPGSRHLFWMSDRRWQLVAQCRQASPICSPCHICIAPVAVVAAAAAVFSHHHHRRCRLSDSLSFSPIFSSLFDISLYLFARIESLAP